jgi:ABC-2 type transport system permease protein
MKKILSAIYPEWIKIFNYRTFWILTGVYTSTLVLLMFSLQGIINNITFNVNNKSPLPIPDFSVYSFPAVWQNLTYIAGFLKIFPAFLIIILVTNEFTFNTLKQQIITGSTRLEFLTGKIFLILIFAISVAILIGITGLIAGLMQESPDFKEIIGSKLLFIPAHALELFTYMMFAAFLAVLLKRAGIAVIAFLLYSLILERILAFRLPDNISRFLPLEATGNLIPLPNSSLMKLFGVSFSEYTSMSDIAICSGWVIVFALLIYSILLKRDL